jgi:gamma-glutamyltranspeptidase/glutathione hydrolase/leukotriene-C4 hydrolase
MDDFSTPGAINFFGLLPSEANFIEPQKRPISSMCPAIVLDENENVRLVIGSSGGTRIVTAVSLVALRNLFIDMNIKEAIDQSRFHHQLFPSNGEIEDNYPEVVFVNYFFL